MFYDGVDNIGQEEEAEDSVLEKEEEKDVVRLEDVVVEWFAA